MTIHVGELSTEVETVPEPDLREARHEPPAWAEQTKLRAHLARIARDAARTLAEEFND